MLGKNWMGYKKYISLFNVMQNGELKMKGATVA